MEIKFNIDENELDKKILARIDKLVGTGTAAGIAKDTIQEVVNHAVCLAFEHEIKNYLNGRSGLALERELEYKLGSVVSNMITEKWTRTIADIERLDKEECFKFGIKMGAFLQKYEYFTPESFEKVEDHFFKYTANCIVHSIRMNPGRYEKLAKAICEVKAE